MISLLAMMLLDAMNRRVRRRGESSSQRRNIRSEAGRKSECNEEPYGCVSASTVGDDVAQCDELAGTTDVGGVYRRLTNQGVPRLG